MENKTCNVLHGVKTMYISVFIYIYISHFTFKICFPNINRCVQNPILTRRETIIFKELDVSRI